ncbi:MAG: hypothetical protein ACR2RB_17205 [Gammaproteobacteria bacterium]
MEVVDVDVDHMRIANLIVTALCLLLPGMATAYTKDDDSRRAVSDGSYQDTNAALQYIHSKGQDDWVLVVGSPGTTYDWASALNVNTGRTLTIEGAGNCTAVERGACSSDTRPTINMSGGHEAFSVTATNGKLVRVTNFILTNSTAPFAGIRIHGWSDRPSWRVDRVRFVNMAVRALVVGRPNSAAGGIGPYGLVDNCWFESTGAAHNGIYLWFGNDSNSWTTAHSFGTDKTIVVEDSTFNRTARTVAGKPAIDSAYNGVRWLMRYCTLNNWVAVLHGPDSAPTSTLQVEFNHNTVRVDSVTDYVLHIRGGTGVATKNTIGIAGDASRAGYNAAWKMVRNGPCASGYPCFQQVGRGSVNGAEGSVPWHFWDNTYELGGCCIGKIASSSSDVRENRDYLFVAKPGYAELKHPHPLTMRLGNDSAPGAPANLRVTAAQEASR